MKRIRLGGVDFSGFEGQLEISEEELADIPRMECCLCHRLQLVDKKYLCDGEKVCPFISEMIKGIYVDCVEF